MDYDSNGDDEDRIQWTAARYLPVDKFDCYRRRDKCMLPLKDSEPNVSESHLRTNIDYF